MKAAIPAQLSKLLPLLGSDKDGEVVATARAICRTLDTAGLDLHDLAEAIDRPKPKRQPLPDQPSWQAPHGRTNPDSDQVSWCFRMGVDGLPGKDQRFLADVAPRLRRWGGRLTPSQRAWLGDICRKLEERAA